MVLGFAQIAPAKVVPELHPPIDGVRQTPQVHIFEREAARIHESFLLSPLPSHVEEARQSCAS